MDNTKMLEVAYIHDTSSEWYTFMRDSMFSDVDYVCEQYDFSDDIPESELNYTTRGEIINLYVNEVVYGNIYTVVVLSVGDIVIYKKVDSNEQ